MIRFPHFTPFIFALMLSAWPWLPVGFAQRLVAS